MTRLKLDEKRDWGREEGGTTEGGKGKVFEDTREREKRKETNDHCTHSRSSCSCYHWEFLCSLDYYYYQRWGRKRERGREEEIVKGRESDKKYTRNRMKNKKKKKGQRKDTNQKNEGRVKKKI